MSENFESMTTQELVAVYNGLNPACELKSWKQSKSKLIGRIEKLQLDLRGKKIPPRKPTEKRTIREAAIDLLCHVEYYEDLELKTDREKNVVTENHPNARSVGIPYDKILDLIKEEFPNSNTSIACLRWYSVKIRVEEFGYEGLVLPQNRPRVRPTIKR